MKMMRAARLHKVGEPFRVDEIHVPEPRPTDVLVKVQACVVPSLHNVVAYYPEWFPFLPLPVSSHVVGVKPVTVCTSTPVFRAAAVPPAADVITRTARHIRFRVTSASVPARRESS